MSNERDLSEDVVAELVSAAIAARKHAYAPFSKFYVGAAVLGDDGRVYAGVNVENSSYGATICAERIAAGAAITAGAKSLRAVAIATPSVAGPCGVCRQFLYEFGPTMRVLLIDSDSGEVRRDVSLSELLPDGFILRED